MTALLTFVALVNPGRARPSPARAGLTLASVAALAGASHWILDALDLSAESFRIGAGAVLAAAAVLALARRADEAWWPAAAAAATTFGADRGVLLTVVAAAGAVAVATAVPDRARRPAVAAGFSLLLLALAAGRITAGILDV